MRPVLPKTTSPAMLVDRARKELLDAREEGLFARLMAALPQRGLEFLEHLLLLGLQDDGSLYHHLAKQIAGRAAAHRVNTFFAHPKYASGLSLAGYLQDHLTVERRHLDRTAEGRGRKADRNLAGQMTALALEDGMFANPHLDIQVSGGSAVAARLALAVQANAVAGIDPGGHGDG